ncbi:MotA/TolQ/ExbB proton channel family protein [Huintestinicola sp.]|uniref:MotA/TolQ/ExbB proton channel family protein n=1 Tax=Huintestinicola sp. TaxID=2981661 RepID=UPI003D7EE442
MSFINVLLNSGSDNFLIIIVAILELALFISSIILSIWISKYFKDGKERDLKKSIYYALDIVYNVFVTIISMFPLLGMLGTVISLIGLGNVFQMDGADMNGIKSEFFLALTSTAWGIIFSLIYKSFNAVAQPTIENQIEKAKKVLKI